MFHKITKVSTLSNFRLEIHFYNGIVKEYDLAPLLKAFPHFALLETSNNLFDAVKIDIGGYGIYWNANIDISSEELWYHGAYKHKEIGG